MRFCVLGRLRVVDEEGRAVALTAPRQRVLLAALLARANQVVPADTLAELVWDGAVPEGAATTLRSYVMRLRKAVGPQIAARIQTREPGYLAVVEPGELDAALFEELAAQMGDAIGEGNRWKVAAQTAAEALALWRETPLIDVPSQALRDHWLPRLEQQYTQLREWRIVAELEQGTSAEALLPQITSLLEEQPLRESLYALKMRILTQAGRPGEALTAYHDARTVLRDELGVEPGVELRRIQQTILAADKTDVPRELPEDVRAFVGREEELARLEALARTSAVSESCETAVLSAIDGMGGVGKSALAVHAAHRVRTGFPDGQIFVDFRGSVPGLAPLTAEDALESVLRTLNVPANRIPRGLAERTALYRTRLAGTRTLLLLDNVMSSAQVRPLLPVGPGCVVLITSRSLLEGLDDAHFISLDVLGLADAVALLRAVAGAGRLPSDDAALGELAQLCGRLPLTIRIAAAHLRHRRNLDLSDYITHLREVADPLDALSAGGSSLTAVFDASYEDLGEPEQRLFRLLSLVPGQDFDAYAAASLLGGTYRTAERLLESLLTQNLIAQRKPGRYEFHDLLRVYARRIAEREAEREGDADDAAWNRLMDFYEQTARLAESRIAAAHSARPTALAPELDDVPAASAWLRAERENLLAAIAAAKARGQKSRVLGLTSAATGWFRQAVSGRLAIRLHAQAVDCALELGRPLDAAAQLLALGEAQRRTGERAAAAKAFEQAVELSREHGDRALEAKALRDLGFHFHSAADYESAQRFYDQSLELGRAIGAHRLVGNVLVVSSRIHQARGEIARSLEMKQEALALLEQVGDRIGAAGCRYELGRLKARVGETDEATEHLERSLAAFRDADSLYNVAHSQWELGRIRLTAGRAALAVSHFQGAFSIFEAQGYRYGMICMRYELGRATFVADGPRAAVAHLLGALAPFRQEGHASGEANVLYELGRVRHALGALRVARLHFDRSLRLFTRQRDPEGQAQVLNALALLIAEVDGPSAALPLHADALQLARDSSSMLEVARALDGSARCHVALGEPELAAAELREAVEVYRKFRAPEPADLEARLAGLGSSSR